MHSRKKCSRIRGDYGDIFYPVLLYKTNLGSVSMTNGRGQTWSSRLRNYGAFIRITGKRVVFLKLRMEEMLEAAAGDASPPWKRVSCYSISFFKIINIIRSLPSKIYRILTIIFLIPQNLKIFQTFNRLLSLSLFSITILIFLIL